MRMIRHLGRVALAAGAALMTTGASLAEPVVVELYTSQGCSSCPPADEILGELSARKDVIALSFHVDYWDYLGWADPFAHESNSERQRAYAQALGARTIYTPQIVVQGANGMVGSRRKVVEMALMGGAEQKLPCDVRLGRDGAALEIEITPTDDDAPEAGRIWLFGYDGPIEQQIERGELGGQTLTYHNVVRETRDLGEWRGAATQLSASIDPLLKGYAVVVQSPDAGAPVGPVIGAAKSERGAGG